MPGSETKMDGFRSLSPVNSSSQEVRPGGSETIMIVDDEPDIVNLLEISMKRLGYTVICAGNGREAVENLIPDIHLIILDIIMPEMDGVAALRCIRERIPDVKVLIASAYVSPEKGALLKRIGVEGFLQKPFRLRQLAYTVRDVLDGSPCNTYHFHGF